MFAPQGVYPCAGHDEWVALTVKDDAAWRRFISATGLKELEDGRLDTLAGRHQHHDRIDEAICEWTRTRDKHDVAALLQAAGIASGPVRTEGDAYFDRHLRERGAFERINHKQPVIGYSAHDYLRLPWTISGHARTALTEYRPTGADTARVLKRWLGMPAAEVRSLRAAGALFHEPHRPLKGRSPAPGTPVDTSFARRLGLPLAGEED